MNTNSKGLPGSKVNIQESYKKYDELPAQIRKVLREAPFNMNSIKTYKFYKACGSIPVTIAAIQEGIKDMPPPDYKEKK
jgi:TRAP-type mannitol/chloroaromatic compound transport system substrate-binding protein